MPTRKTTVPIDSTDELFIRAVAGPPDRPEETWARLSPLLEDLDALGPDYVRLLPAVYDRFSGTRVEHPKLERLKGFYRRSWYHHHVLARHLDAACGELERAEIPAIVMKGMAVVACCVDNPALRPMGDFDVLVRAEQLHEALACLEEAGWRRTESFPVHPLPTFIHALHLELMPGIYCDLHWIASPYLREVSASGDIWARSRTAQLGQRKIRIPGPEDLLLLTLVHGARWGNETRLVWVTDALALLGSHPDLDWDVLVQTARSNHATAATESTLTYLRQFGAPVPDGVLEALESSPRSRAESLGFRGETAPPRGSEWRRRAARMMWPYVRAMAGKGPVALATQLPLYVKEQWKVTSWSDVGRAAWARGRGRHASPTPALAPKRPGP